MPSAETIEDKSARNRSSAGSRGKAPKMNRREMITFLAAAGIAANALPSSGGGIVSGKKNHPLLNTRLTEEYGVKYPFVSAGMAFIGMPPLAAAVANAGGIGMLGVAPEAPPGMVSMVQATRALTDKLFGVNFIIDDTAFGPMTTDAHIDACVAERVKLVTFHWNAPPKRWVDVLHAAGAKVWFQTGIVEQAIEAVRAEVDGIIAQGSEAGGHVRATTRTAETLKSMIASVPRSVLILAAGGIADGQAVAKALRHGADGVWVGTRLVASVEANAHSEYKQRLVTASGLATVHTTMFGPEWPGQRIQVLRNSVVNEWAGREGDIPSPPPPPAIIGHTKLMPNSVPDGVPYDMPKFSAMLPTPDASGDFDEMCMPAGECAKQIKNILPAARIVEEMMSEAQLMIEH